MTHGRDLVLLEREVGSTQVKEIFRTPSGNTSWIRVSPDGRLVGFVREEPDSKTSTFVVATLSGGAPRTLFTAAGAYALDGQRWQWTPDSQEVFVTKNVTAGREVWHLRLTGPARKLDIDGRQWGEGFAVHPDARQIAFVAQAGEPGAEVWALENFLPARAAKR